MNTTHSIDSSAKLEAAYHDLIPISGHMGIRVRSWADDRLVLTAPLAPNVNHQASAFGGSLFSIAALAGWGLIQLKLARLERPSNTVIANTDVGFKRPVFGEIECVCELPESWEATEEALLENGRVSLILKPQIETGGEIAMTLSGRYVVSLDE